MFRTVEYVFSKDFDVDQSILVDFVESFPYVDHLRLLRDIVRGDRMKHALEHGLLEIVKSLCDHGYTIEDGCEVAESWSSQLSAVHARTGLPQLEQRSWCCRFSWPSGVFKVRLQPRQRV